MAQDHNDIYTIVERLRILEEGLDKNQKSVNQLSATFKPKTVAVLTAKKDPKNPMAGKLVGGNESVESDDEPLDEAVATEDVLDKVKASFADYLKNVADEIKQDTDLKDKKREDSDLKKKEKKDRDLIAKEVDESELGSALSGIIPAQQPAGEEGVSIKEDHRKLEVGDRIAVTAPNEYEGEFGEVVEFAPSGKFVVVRMDNGDEASMHVSDVELHTDEEDFEDDLSEDPTEEDPVIQSSTAPTINPTYAESAPVKTINNECGIWEVHGDENQGFELRTKGRALKSRFKNLEEAEIALEMFAARRAAEQQHAEESADYIDEA